MTFQAARCIVRNVFLIVFFIHLSLVMAAETCPRLSVRGMAAGTITIGTTMVHGKAVIERGTLPGGCVMATRALLFKVVDWPVAQMARLAVCRPNRLVVECAVAPRSGVVTLRALTFEVVGWLVVLVTSSTVRCTSCLVVESRADPGCSNVA